MPDVMWYSAQSGKGYIVSGMLSSTIKTSLSMPAAGNPYHSLSPYRTDTLATQPGNAKIHHVSGQFTTTIKNSNSYGDFWSHPRGLKYTDALNPTEGDTFWTARSAQKLIRESSILTRTIRSSFQHDGIQEDAQGISYNPVTDNTLWIFINDEEEGAYAQSGAISSTVRASNSLNLTGNYTGISSADNVDCLASRDVNSPDWNTKIFLMSGQFTNTVKQSFVSGYLQSTSGDIEVTPEQLPDSGGGGGVKAGIGTMRRPVWWKHTNRGIR